jgi:hypothetical protein
MLGSRNQRYEAIGSTSSDASLQRSAKPPLEKQMDFLPITRMWQRVESARNDADTTFFFHLLYAGEMIVKLIAAGLVAAIVDDRDRHRYRQIHRVVRSDGLGDWREVIDEVLTGPTSSQYLNPAVYEEQRELLQKLGSGTWQHEAATALLEALEICESGQLPLPGKLDGRKCIDLLVRIRNATRGHGAVPPAVCSRVCPKLERGLVLIYENFRLFKRPWAFLHRNLSGKYRVTKWSVETDQFEQLKSGRTADLPNLADGVYICLDQFTPVELIESDQDASDFLFPNGKFNDTRYELLSYVTGNKRLADASRYLAPPNLLPESETRGRGSLDVQGQSFGNLPPAPTGYIPRPAREKELTDALSNDRHPVVTLVGSGGIGKTSLALQVLHQVLTKSDGFDAVVWLSSRDIDLMPEGPKIVRPEVLTVPDMARKVVDLLEPVERLHKGFDPQEYFSRALGQGPAGKTLFVFDNFETIRNPTETYKWLDTYIRLPNKILITSRFREFKGDYFVEVTGMEGPECDALIDAVARGLNIHDLLTEDYRREVQTESSGHPYVIKILLGEVAKAKKLVRVERIMASKDSILEALFERTYAGLTPAARRVFLTLCGWRSVLPLVALEAVLLREINERIDIDVAVDELFRSSLVELSTSEADNTQWIAVPLAASMFGQRKLSASATKVSVDADIKILQSFGATQSSGIKRGIGPRIELIFKTVASRSKTCADTRGEYLPILESIARRYPPAYLLLASLYEELECNVEQAKECVRRFLEASRPVDQREGWEYLRRLCAYSKDWVGEIHALVELADLPDATIETISAVANRLNSLFRDDLLILDTDEKQILVKRLISLMETQSAGADAGDFSRLAWLCLQLHDRPRAIKWTEKGLQVEPGNIHCLKLAQRLDLQQFS